MPEGNPADYVAPPQRSAPMLGAPSLMLSSGTPYMPAPNTDDYRCFILGDALASDTYLTAMDILPDVRNEVHHVQIHRVSSANMAAVRGLDAADPAPGYLCLAGTGTVSQNMFSWRPGSNGVAFDKGEAAFIEAGSTLLIQVHYDTQLLPKGQSPAPDDAHGRGAAQRGRRRRVHGRGVALGLPLAARLSVREGGAVRTRRSARGDL